MKAKLETFVNWAIKIMLGVVLVLTVQFILATYQRLDALIVAWENPDVVSELEIETSMEVVSK